MCLFLVLNTGKVVILAGHQIPSSQGEEHQTGTLRSCYTFEEAAQHQTHSSAELRSGLEAEI